MQENIKQVTVKRTVRMAFRTEPIWQYDVGHELVFDGFELPTAFEVHFSRSPMGQSITQIGTENKVTLPDMYAQSAGTIYAWLYIAGEDTGLTKYSIEIPVNRRARITDQQPTPVEQSAIDQAIAALNAGVDAAEAAQDAAEEAQGKAEQAQAGAEAAEDGAEAAKLAAQGFASAADDSATAAGRSATAAEASATAAAGSASDAEGSASAAAQTKSAIDDEVTGFQAQIDDLDESVSDVLRAITKINSNVDYLNKKYFTKNISSDSDSIVYEPTGIKMATNEQIVLVQKGTTTLCVAYVYPQAYADGTDIKTKGTYTLTAENDGELYIAHRAADVDIYYPDFSIVSEEGSSKTLAASQYLVKTAFDEIDSLGNDVEELSDQLDGKYDRYTEVQESGITQDMFSAFPSVYTIVTYDNTDALKHGNFASTGKTYLSLPFKSEYNDFTAKLHYGAFNANPPVKIILAKNSEYSLAFTLNATSGNVNKYTDTSSSYASGIIRNTNCRDVAAGDEIHFLRNGNKVALYLIDNGIEVPIFESEYVDIVSTYGVTTQDLCFGLLTTNVARNEFLLYDLNRDVIHGDHFMPYDEVEERLSALENGAGFNPYKVDLFMFMGQSNMAGRGTGNQAPEVADRAGYEFRAISDPTKLYPIVEPFGIDENVQDSIYDYLGGYKAKSGDMIPSFVNAYFEHTHVSIVGVSASEGGTRISLWQPDTARDSDALTRYNAAVTWLTSNGYTIRHKYMLWCQGESNGDDGMSKADYKSAFATFAGAWFGRGIETIFLVKIGNYNGTGEQDYNTIMTAQNEICQETPKVVMVSTDFAGMKARDLMKDDFHYKQAAYNEVGTYAGINTAIYVNTGKEPTMYDTQDGSLYYSHKN